MKENVTDTLLRVLEYRDVYTRGHTDRGVFYALMIGENMGLSTKELEYLRMCGMVHDVGKSGNRKDKMELSIHGPNGCHKR